MIEIFILCMLFHIVILSGITMLKLKKLLQRTIMIENCIDNIQDTIWSMQDKIEYIDNSLIAINKKLGLEDKELGEEGIIKILASVKERGKIKGLDGG